MTKFYKTRDAATSALRKLGVNVRDYNLFIFKGMHEEVAGFEVQLELAKEHVAKVAAQTDTDEAPPKHVAKDEPEAKVSKAAKKPSKKEAAAAKAAKPAVSKAGTCSARARELILAGRTNQEVWDIISVEFSLDDKKRLYPAWYRRELRNKGHKV